MSIIRTIQTKLKNHQIVKNACKRLDWEVTSQNQELVVRPFRSADGTRRENDAYRKNLRVLADGNVSYDSDYETELVKACEQLNQEYVVQTLEPVLLEQYGMVVTSREEVNGELVLCFSE